MNDKNDPIANPGDVMTGDTWDDDGGDSTIVAHVAPSFEALSPERTPVASAIVDDDFSHDDGPTMALAPGAGLRRSGGAMPPRSPFADRQTEDEMTQTLCVQDFTPQDGHVVVGTDARGDDATMALAPRGVRANVATPRTESFGAQLPRQVPPPIPPPIHAPPPFAGWSAGAMPGANMDVGLPPSPGPGAPWERRSPQADSGPPTGQSPPGLEGQTPDPRLSQPRAGLLGVPPAARDAFSAFASPGKKQLLVLVVVCVVCLAIFATGIALFVTTKF